MTPTSSKPACPQCGNTTDFAQRDLVPGLALFTPMLTSDGVVDPRWSGETRMGWDDQRPASNPPEFVCLACDHLFTEFALVPADVGA